MPRIPTIIAESRLSSGPVAPEASALAFSGGAAGLDDLGAGMANLGQSIQRMDQQRRQDEASKATSTLSAQFVEETSAFLEDEANTSKEDYDKITLDYLKQKKGEYLKKAPPEARQALDGVLSNYTNTQYRSALRRSSENRVQNQTLAVQESINATLSGFRNIKDPQQAASVVDPIRDQIHGHISQVFKDAPTSAAKLHEIVDRDFVLAAAERDPAYARQILDGSSYVDEVTRRQLNNAIEEYENAAAVETRSIVKQALVDRLAIGKGRGQPVEMPQDSIFSVFGKGAEQVKAWFQGEMETHNKALKLTGDLKDKNARYQAQQLGKAAEGVKGESDFNALNTARQRLDDAAKQQIQDPAGWLLENNLDVHSAFQKAEGLPDEHRPQAMATAYDLALEYQGAPPENLTPEAAARYLNLPTHARHVMTQGSATVRAREIRQGSASQQLEALRALEQTFAKKEHWAIAYNDLVTLPPQGQGIPQELQLAFLIEDPAVQKQFIGAISNQEGIKGLNEELRTEYTEKLEGQATWKSFREAFIGDMFGGTIPLEGHRDGLLKYAYALSLTGMKPKDAVDAAVQRVIGDHMGFAKVNGQTIAVPKFRNINALGPQLPPRTDEEIKDLGRRMALAMRDLDTRQISRSNEYGGAMFPTLPPLPQGSVEVEQHLRDIVTSRGYFVPDADGESVTLYVMGDNGIGMQLRDTNGHPFELHLDSLPKFIKAQALPWKPTPELPRKTYDITGKVYTGVMPWQTQTRTNWPVTAEYWFRQMQKPPFSVPADQRQVPPVK